MTPQQMARMASILRQAINADCMDSPDGSPSVPLQLATNLFGAGNGDSDGSSSASNSRSNHFGEADIATSSCVRRAITGATQNAQSPSR